MSPVALTAPGRRPGQPGEIPLGEQRDVRIALQPVNGFGAPVALAADAPAAVTASLDPDTLTGQAGTAVLELTGEAGAGQVVVSAQGGGTLRRVPVAFRVVEPPPPDAVLALALEAEELRIIPVSLSAGHVVAVRVTVEEGDVDVSAFNAASERVDFSANNGTDPERVDLSGPGEFAVEVRAIVSSRVKIATGAPLLLALSEGSEIEIE